MDMLAKYLFSTFNARRIDAEPSAEALVIKDGLAITRKTDVLMHSDMGERIGIRAIGGGFIKHLSKVGRQNFYGVSESCRVKTDEEMAKNIYSPLYEKGQWWTFDFEMYRSKYAIFVVLPEGYIPSSHITGIDWKKTTHAEAYEIMEAEADAACGW
jgi:hypothetical protein